MSRDLCVCSVAVENLKAAYGSRSRELLDKILTERESDIRAHDDYFQKVLKVSPYTSIAEFVEQVINGVIDPCAKPVFQFEHAVVFIAEALGEPLDSDMFLGTNPDLWADIGKVIKHGLHTAEVSHSYWPTLDEILERGPLLPVPLDPKMRLGTGYLTEKETAEALEAASRIDLGKLRVSNLRWPREALAAASAYREWLREASQRQQGLFFHS